MFNSIPTETNLKTKNPTEIQTKNLSVNNLIKSIDYANKATELSNRNKPYSELNDTIMSRIINIQRNALNEAIQVDINQLNKRYPNFGTQFEAKYIKGLKMVIEGSEKNNTQEFITIRLLLDEWGNWYSSN